MWYCSFSYICMQPAQYLGGLIQNVFGLSGSRVFLPITHPSHRFRISVFVFIPTTAPDDIIDCNNGFICMPHTSMPQCESLLIYINITVCCHHVAVAAKVDNSNNLFLNAAVNTPNHLMIRLHLRSLNISGLLYSSVTDRHRFSVLTAHTILMWM